MAPSAVTTTLFALHDEPRRMLTLLRGADRAAETIRVAVAEGRRLVRAGVRVLLGREAGIAAVGEAANRAEAVALTRRIRPDVVLVDVQLPGLGCVDATRMMLVEPGVTVMLLSASESDGRLVAGLRAGAGVVLPKGAKPGELATAVRLLGRGGRQRAHRRNRNQSCWEDGMLTPKVIEIRRGCAHGPPVAPLPKATAGARQHAE
jgi:DNA-binding NarL/FixJ family response regulator